MNFCLLAAMAGTLFQSPNLTLRRFTVDDGVFIYELLNTQSWKQFIGDRNILTMDDALNYNNKGPLASYDKYGYGPWLVALKENGQPIGMCGLFKRDYLSLPDLGFAFLPGFEGKGFGYESGLATISYAAQHYNIHGLFATTTQVNIRSQKLLERCGFLKKDLINPDGLADELILYYRDL